MTDVIRNINSSQVAGSGAKPTTSSDDATKSAQKTSTASTTSVRAAIDQVDLTNSAQTVDKAIQSIASEPVVDRQKVDEIKSALAEGRYEVNSAAIADKLIEIDELLK